MAEAKGVEQKAKAMKALDGVGKEHEEFKLRLEKDKEVELANIDVQKSIAEAQALALAEAFKSANIDIVGGEETFINNIMNAINRGKTVDRLVGSSNQLTDLKHALIGNGNGNKGLLGQVSELVKSAGLKSDDVKNLSMAALLLKLQNKVGDKDKSLVSDLLNTVTQLGLGQAKADNLL